MELVTLACNECAAPLSVAAQTRFVTCDHCGAQLEVHRRDGASWTEKIEKLEERVARLEAADRPRRRRPWRRWNQEREQEEFAVGRLAALEVAVVVMAWFGSVDPYLLVGLVALCVAILAIVVVQQRKKERAQDERRRARQSRRRAGPESRA